MTKWEVLPMGRCSLLVGLRSSSRSLDQIVLLFNKKMLIFSPQAVQEVSAHASETSSSEEEASCQRYCLLYIIIFLTLGSQPKAPLKVSNGSNRVY